MNEENARKILDKDESTIQEDNSLFSISRYLVWDDREDEACLDGDFSAEDLEAIAWWMRNKKTEGMKIK